MLSAKNKFNRFFVMLILICLMMGCAPSNHVYVKPHYQDQPFSISNVLIMIEYLEIKDDIKGLWNFSEGRNLFQQDQLYATAQLMLEQKGYGVAAMHLKTSGLIIDRSFAVEHYIGDKQQGVISPPYIVRSYNLDESQIQGLEMLLAELNRPLSPAMVDLRSYVKNNYKQQMSAIDLDDNMAILIIQVYRPRVSVFANVGVMVSLSSSGSHGSYVGVGGHNQSPISVAYLLHKGTGDVIWSNKTTLITEKNRDKFFTELPFNAEQ